MLTLVVTAVITLEAAVELEGGGGAPRINLIIPGQGKFG
jgi:hypothetical protein